jgi:hypothetical protein
LPKKLFMILNLILTVSMTIKTLSADGTDARMQSVHHIV